MTGQVIAQPHMGGQEIHHGGQATTSEPEEQPEADEQEEAQEAQEEEPIEDKEPADKKED